MASILLVDDDDQFRRMFSRILVRADHQVVEACEGQEALDIYGKQPTDLVITDLVMPGKEGLEMIVEFQQLYPEAKIIAISGGGRVGPQDYLRMAKAFGAKRVLTKPFLRDEMLEAIDQVLNESAA